MNPELELLKEQCQLELDHRNRRDMFAAAALTGLLSDHTYGAAADESARHATSYADALIAELDKTRVKPEPKPEST